jgi:hypothetical protein
MSTGAALANGRYPAASLLAFDPVDAQHLVISTTFGLLESRDGGKSFLWRCESAIGVSDQQDLMVAITASGATVTTRVDGIAFTSDGCSFAKPSELAGKSIDDLALYRSEPHSVVAFSEASRLEGGFDSQLFRSKDDGRTWTALGAPLPTELLPLTVDPAPSDASRLYLTGRHGGESQFSSLLLRSLDGGATFAGTDVPETAQHHLAFIAAVHPSDPSRVYLRVYHPSGTAIVITDDGGTTFRKIFTGNDQILGFALSSDATQMAFGGPGDGIWVGSADGTNLVRRSDVRPTCLGWTTEGLFACADAKVDGFSFGRSRDEGATFEPLFAFSSLCGATGCSPDSSTATTCAADWEIVGPTLGATCGLDAGVHEAGGREAAGPPDAVAGGAIDSSADAETSSQASLNASGGACALGRGNSGSAMVGFVLSALATRRRRERPTSRRPKLV